ncbi:MAG TPA: FtsX-like permease family protein [Egicoccus sp.]|nr:FtsX-like permease family protein [Egicoccus sp.]HSK24277.1 FtsX-like permease family protein [Egicoccus sp.]
MWKLTLKGLLAHRIRLALTTLSVVLGVAFVAGTFVMTDTMLAVFDDLVRGGTQSVDVMVRSRGAAETEIGSADAYYGTVPFDDDVLDVVAAVDGVEIAEGAVEGYALIVRPDGEPILPMGPPTIGASWSAAGRTVEPGGRAPAGPDEVAVDAATAQRNGLEVGDRLEIVFATVAPRSFTLVGISSAEGSENLAGASLAEFDLATAQEVLDLEGVFTTIGVWGAEDVDSEVLTERVAAAVPAGVDAISAADWADETMAQIEEALAFVTIALGVFAAIALLVGAFIIANTFSITVLQRSREFALLRALGASRRQVVAGVVGEAVVVGLLASLTGILAGLGLARGLQALLSLFGLDMPSGALVVQPRTVAVSLTVGVAVTVVSALLPARRASAVHPIAALRRADTGAYRPSRLRLGAGIGAAAGAIGVLAYAAAAQPDAGSTVLATGAVLAFVALTLTGPALTRPVLRVLGGRGEHLGVPGHLARSNSMRTPRRTWTTAAALTVGVALVSSVAVMSASMKASAAEALDETLKADVIVSAGGMFAGGLLPPIVAREIAQSPDIAAVSALRVGSGEFDGAAAAAFALDPTTWDELHTTEVAAGSFAEVAGVDAVAVDTDLATERGYEVGDVVSATFPASGATQLRIVALYEPDMVLTGWVVSMDSAEDSFAQPLDAAVLVAGTGDAATTRAAVEAVTADYPAVTVQNQAEYRDAVAGQIDQMLALVTALLAMALVIAVLGIMNTLALSIHERTREIGLLRAVGMTRRQVRAMVRWEAVSVALLGAVVGLVLGTLFGWVTTRVLAEEGMGAFQIPTGQLVGAVVLALLAGVLAAVLPARGAAKLDVLRAVTVE